MAKLPLTTISVVIPVYSGEPYIEQLIDQLCTLRDSLYQQNISLAEIICVLDDARDDSARILNSIVRDCNILRVITLASNVGQHQATSVGILSAGASWIITMDEDLQHSPQAIPTMLHSATENSIDLLYCKSSSRVHKGLSYRDLASSLSKKILTSLTDIDYRGISSFRLIRSEIAKAAAISMDPSLYLDVLLFRLTSPRRRLILYRAMSDPRPHQSSYSISRLKSHFVRFLTSSDLRYGKISTAWLTLSFTIQGSFLSLIVYGFYDGVLDAQPGWASTILAVLFNITVSIFGFLVTYKLMTLLAMRSLRLPSFTVVDRSADLDVASALERSLLHN